MPTTTTLIRRASQAGEGRLAAAESLFERIGWKGSLRPIEATDRRDEMFDLLWAGEPQAVVLLTTSEESSRPVSLGYSREAQYLVLWTPTAIEIQEPQRWTHAPGDAPLLHAGCDMPADVLRLLEHMRPMSVLEDAPRLYGSKGSPKPSLAELLGSALGQLRIQVADIGLMEGTSPESRDSAVLRLFHQLLFIRFQEDRGVRASDVVLSELKTDEDLREPVGRALADYRERLNSELFTTAGITVADLPGKALGSLIRQLVEPWAQLRLDFSVSRTEIAGRLYQNYLRNLPRREPEHDKPRLFGRARGVDERERAASYYTPPALARYVTHETLRRWLRRHRPQRPEDVHVLDPACGSGAFLIAAYRTLLDYFTYTRGRELRASEREEILRASVFGADVDERALGLAQVQLLEEAHVAGRLPRMGDNLLQGDALPAPPGINGGPGQVDWTAVLARMARPFDVVIGNPPFGGHVKVPQRIAIADLQALRKRYPEVEAFGRDYAYIFLALALRLLREGGSTGFVLPRTLLDGVSGRAARNLLAKQDVRLLVDFRAAQLFDAKGYICVAVTGPGRGAEVAGVTDSRTDGRAVLDQLSRHVGNDISIRPIDRTQLAEHAPNGWSAFRLRWELDLRKEIGAATEPLVPNSDPTRAARWGTKPAALSAFVIEPETWKATGPDSVAVGTLEFRDRNVPLLVRSEDITPFHIASTGRRLFLPFEETGQLSSQKQVVAELERRGGLPTNVQRGDLTTLGGPKLIVRAFAREPATVVDVEGKWMPIMGTAGAIAVRMSDISPEDLPAYEALLNSALHQWLLHGLGRPKHDESVELTIPDVEQLPIPSDLDASGLGALKAAGEAVRLALSETDPMLRVHQYRDARLELDNLVFEFLAVSSKLRAIVADELIRTT
jgi:SAM-dependent methyltransferase